jgi:Type II secretion system (T2SS), protein E, N-terminal domain
MTNSSPPPISPEEKEQLLQTIEMFEVIVSANPHDCQSLEILKDAYTRMGMRRELLKISRRMAQTFMELGQFATAILEFEQILRHEPDNPEVIAAMGDCEERMHKSSHTATGRPAGPNGHSGSGSGSAVEGGNLIATSATNRQDSRAGSSVPAFQEGRMAALTTDGNESLAKFLTQNKLVPDVLVHASLERVQKVNRALRESSMARSLLDEIVERGGPTIEAILEGIIDRTKFAYVPLEYYDVDRQVVRMLPEELTLKRLIVPFDVMSRTVMVAMANPFDAPGKEVAQSLLDYNIQWHVASPSSIIKVLSQAYRIGSSEAPAFDSIQGMSKSTEAPVFGEMPVSLSFPELKVSPPSNTPLSGSSKSDGGAPLPDTSDFRLKK